MAALTTVTVKEKSAGVRTLAWFSSVNKVVFLNSLSLDPIRRGARAGVFTPRSCASLPCPSGPRTSPRVFGARYGEAVAWVLDRAEVLRAGIAAENGDPRVLVPVVFPEVLRYSLIRDRIETVGLETLYVSQGPAYADFSIGRFQMKPSFVESLERRLPALAAYDMAASARVVRAARVQRLRDQSWQVRYLSGFGSLIDSSFPRLDADAVTRIRFVAAAYNSGFWRTREAILAAESWKLFPNGMRGTSPYGYGDVAADFYDRIWKAVCDQADER